MDDEIEQVRKAEQRRGLRPVDSELVAQNRRKLAALREIVSYGTIEDLKAVMREYGLAEGSPEWTAALQVWNDERERQ